MQVRHWWDAPRGAGAAALSPRGTPPQCGGHMDRVLCHRVTWWGGEVTGSPRTGIRGRPAAKWGLVPLRGQTRNPGGWGGGRLGHPAVAAPTVTGQPSSPSRSHSFIKAVFLGALAACPAAAPAPPALCVLAFWQWVFFRHSHSQMRLSHLPNSHPRASLGARAPSPTRCCLPGHCSLECVEPLWGCRQMGAGEAHGMVASPCRHGAFGDLGGVCFFEGRAQGLRTHWRRAQWQPQASSRSLMGSRDCRKTLLPALLVIKCLKIESACDPSPEELSSLSRRCLTSPARPLRLLSATTLALWGGKVGWRRRLSPSPGTSTTGGWRLSIEGGAALLGECNALLAPEGPVLMMGNGWR